jgi:predicted nucleotidyltransferase
MSVTSDVDRSTGKRTTKYKAIWNTGARTLKPKDSLEDVAKEPNLAAQNAALDAIIDEHGIPIEENKGE